MGAKLVNVSHTKKPQVTYFNIKKNQPCQISLLQHTLNPVPIPISDQTKVHGLTIDKYLKFNTHIPQKTFIAAGTLSNSERFRDRSKKTKLNFYRAFILPLLWYCPLVLSLPAPSNLKAIGD